MSESIEYQRGEPFRLIRVFRESSDGGTTWSRSCPPPIRGWLLVVAIVTAAETAPGLASRGPHEPRPRRHDPGGAVTSAYMEAER